MEGDNVTALVGILFSTGADSDSAVVGLVGRGEEAAFSEAIMLLAIGAAIWTLDIENAFTTSCATLLHKRSRGHRGSQKFSVRHFGDSARGGLLFR